MPPPPLTDEQLDLVVGQMLAGDVSYIQCPQAMVNHVECYGFMTKKTADGSRVIRYKTDARDMLDEMNGKPNSMNGPSDTIDISHPPGTFADVFCEFNHGVHELFVEPDVNRSGAPRQRSQDSFTAWLSLAQLKDLGQECGLCSALAQGVERWKWIWQGPMNKYRYCDMVWDNRHLLHQGGHMQLFAEADEGHYDERFIPCPVKDGEVALRISFSRDKQTLEIYVQKYAHPPMKKRTGLLTLEVFVDHGVRSPWNAIRELPMVSQNVLSESSVKKLEGWINECVQNHELCKRPESLRAQPPTRLIEITSPITGELSIRLIETKEDEKYAYVALSHSWASSKPLKTDKHNYLEHKDDIPWDDLSTVYQDTITLANALSIKYVWIDSLCIIQQDAEEWGREAHYMGRVYSNAFLVFVALGGELALEKDPIESFTIHGTETETGKDVHKSTIHVRRKIEHDNLVNSANDDTTGEWFSRGWCFQERLFASRLLHFGGGLEDITFECNTEITCECGGVDTLVAKGAFAGKDKSELSSLWCHAKAQFMREFDAITRKTPDELEEEELEEVRNQLLAMYISLCEDFSAKRFSFSDDKLPAMDSLASKLGPYLGSYHAGLWEHNILIGMQWESFDATRSRRYSPCCAPSFSWASCTGGAIWYMDAKEVLGDNEDFQCAEIVDVNTVPADPNIPYGKVIFSSIVLRGFAKPAIIETQEADRVGRMYLNDPDSEQWVQIDTQDDIDEICARHYDDPMPVLCFRLSEKQTTSARETRRFVSTIVLTPLDGEQGILRRIGFAILDAAFFNEEALFATVSIW